MRVSKRKAHEIDVWAFIGSAMVIAVLGATMMAWITGREWRVAMNEMSAPVLTVQQ